MYLHRLLETQLANVLEREKSVLLLGPRQTGKTTLIQQIPSDKQFTLANPKDRLRYEKEPFLLTSEIEALKTSTKKPLVVIDEIQKVPLLLDAVQDLIDRKIAKFILTGSSARKIKRGSNINLLPGRIIPLRLDPITHLEFTDFYPSLQDVLLHGALPEILLEKNQSNVETLLDAYVTLYLEEEIRAEAMVRDLGHFARFLELAASESGKIVNFSKLSQEIGVAHSTIANYYQILEDCLIIERVEPLTLSSTRRKLSKSQKYLFYDLGVRRLAAHEGTRLPRDQLGYLFEQYVGLELIRMIRLFHPRFFLKYWRDPAGPEVDWVIDMGKTYIPIEVKWTETPTLQDAKHLQVFLKEYSAKNGFIICQTPHVMKLNENIYALPWKKMMEIFKY
jgi:predicted AAA+ superfamily ATPase